MVVEAVVGRRAAVGPNLPAPRVLVALGGGEVAAALVTITVLPLPRLRRQVQVVSLPSCAHMLDRDGACSLQART